MENIIKKLKNASRNTRLSVVEKATIKNVLIRYVKSHPAHARTFTPRSIPSPFNLNNFRNKRTLSAFIIGGLLVGGTASFAAENTVPGDILYPVKVHVNEQVMAAIAVTPQAQADWGVRKAERRLEEVEKLAVEPAATPEVKAIADASFSDSAKHVQEHIRAFENNNDSEDAIATAGKFTDMLRRHEGDFDKQDFSLQDVSIPVSATSTGSEQVTSSTTPVVLKKEHQTRAKKEVKRTSVESVIGNIRDARGNAEKIQNELKNKYPQEVAPATQATSTEPIINQAKEVSPRENRSFNYETSTGNHVEEIHTTPTSNQKRGEND